jgi:glycosyltransferase involved in cell wall biosynthesis
MLISATIVTLNEERNIARAIRSLACADEILIVDSGSTDRTREIAAGLGARVIEEPWRGYAAQKNFAACCASHDWILSLDADEELTPELASEIAALKQTSAPPCDGYSFPRLAQYLGRWIHHSGWYPDRKVRFYDRRKGKWVGDYVHESVRVEGSVGELGGDLLHYTCASISEHMRTLDRYTTLAAQEVAARGQSVPFIRLTMDPCWTFFRTFYLQRGFLDGRQGLILAVMAGLYTFLKYAKASFLNENPPSR